jgi:hypothetical protein
MKKRGLRENTFEPNTFAELWAAGRRACKHTLRARSGTYALVVLDTQNAGSGAGSGGRNRAEEH